VWRRRHGLVCNQLASDASGGDEALDLLLRVRPLAVRVVHHLPTPTRVKTRRPQPVGLAGSGARHKGRLEVEVPPRVGDDGRVLDGARLGAHVVVPLEVARVGQVGERDLLLEEREGQRLRKQPPEAAVAVQVRHPHEEQRPVERRRHRHG